MLRFAGLLPVKEGKEFTLAFVNFAEGTNPEKCRSMCSSLDGSKPSWNMVSIDDTPHHMPRPITKKHLTWHLIVKCGPGFYLAPSPFHANCQILMSHKQSQGTEISVREQGVVGDGKAAGKRKRETPEEKQERLAALREKFPYLENWDTR